MKKTFILAASLLFCACGGQQNQNQATENSKDSAVLQAEQSTEVNAEASSLECNLSESEIKAKLKEKGYNRLSYDDIDHDGCDEILVADYDPAEGGCIFKLGVYLKDNDLTCVAETQGDREDVGICLNMVVKMNLDDEGIENYEISQIINSKVSPAPDDQMVPDYMSLSNFAIETWEEIYDN